MFINYSNNSNNQLLIKKLFFKVILKCFVFKIKVLIYQYFLKLLSKLCLRFLIFAIICYNKKKLANNKICPKSYIKLCAISRISPKF